MRARIRAYLKQLGVNLLVVATTLSLMLGWALIGALLPLPDWLFTPFWLGGILGAAFIIIGLFRA